MDNYKLKIIYDDYAIGLIKFNTRAEKNRRLAGEHVIRIPNTELGDIHYSITVQYLKTTDTKNKYIDFSTNLTNPVLVKINKKNIMGVYFDNYFNIVELSTMFLLESIKTDMQIISIQQIDEIIVIITEADVLTLSLNKLKNKLKTYKFYDNIKDFEIRGRKIKCDFYNGTSQIVIIE